MPERRGAHYLALAVVWAVVCLPNLGAPSLWDIDEGNNAACSQTMYESGDWILPTFNTHIRYDKPALLYWLQLSCYRAFGVNEFAARLPSAVAALAAVLATYELGRRAFRARVGLLAGLIAATTGGFCAAAHFANPDALLNACTALTLWLFFNAYRRGGRWWSLATGVTTGLGVLAKGPVGIVLPSTVMLLFLAWDRQLRRLGDWRVLSGVLTFVLVAVPWYAWVGAETKWEWLAVFLGTHNRDRFLSPMEGHGGSVLYYVVMLSVGFLPWSVFLAMTAWNAVVELRSSARPAPAPAKCSGWRSLLALAAARVPRPADNPNQSAVRFLTAWVAVYFVAFSASGTKLPNYILPLYPAVAVLMARVLDRYRSGEVRVPLWSMRLSFLVLAFVGIGMAVGALVAGDVAPLEIMRGRSFPGVQYLAAAGVVPVSGAALAWWSARRGRRAAVLRVLAATAVLLIGVVAACGPVLVDRAKAPRELVRMMPADQEFREVRVATYGYFQPSLVFYCQREVLTWENHRQVQDFLDGPLPSYLFVPAEQWNELRPRLTVRCHVLGAKYDLYDGCDIIVVTNEPERLAPVASLH
jgi:4-amino-4-deoxy-L-arabinose transferase-like glycosyltransferase